MLKGLVWEEALILAGLALALRPSRRHFNRKAALTEEPFSWRWTLAVGSVVAETYQVTRLLGRGGLGAVWEAYHLRLPGSRVASTSRPCPARTAVSKRIWVLLPAPSPPSKVMKRPRVTVQLPEPDTRCIAAAPIRPMKPRRSTS